MVHGPQSTSLRYLLVVLPMFSLSANVHVLVKAIGKIISDTNMMASTKKTAPLDIIVDTLRP
ncbi:MAG TPA: hypothetical protein VEL11_02110 [Candidatus Bathyarchaeia archaeon]|nr:hypothetical protein [Candidatus Bathyarchaeia archaeon]